MNSATTISILIPSLGRSSHVARVLDNIIKNTTPPFEVVFIVENPEFAEYMRETSPYFGDLDVYVVKNVNSKSYGGAINSGYKYATGEYVFLGSDDLNFHPGWDLEALSTMVRLPHIKVVGTNDLFNAFVLEGLHSTHSLVDRDYIDRVGGVIDQSPGQVLYEGYAHNFVDTEFIGTAKARAVFAPCLASVVEHLHWLAEKSDKDATYEKSEVGMQADADIYYPRRELWWSVSK